MDPFAAALALVTASFGILVAFYALHLAVQTRIECRALKESTHSVQYVPYAPDFSQEDERVDAENSRGEARAYDNLSDIHEIDEPLN